MVFNIHTCHVSCQLNSVSILKIESRRLGLGSYPDFLAFVLTLSVTGKRHHPFSHAIRNCHALLVVCCVHSYSDRRSQGVVHDEQLHMWSKSLHSDIHLHRWFYSSQHQQLESGRSCKLNRNNKNIECKSTGFVS